MGKKKNRNERIGAVYTMKNGKKAECVEYNSSTDIKIKFEDGTSVRTTWYKFTQGIVPRDACKLAMERVGTVFTMGNGEKAECIEYINAMNVIIRHEDGRTQKVSWDRFKKGKCHHHDVKVFRYKRLGTRVYQKNAGMEAECVGYRKSTDIDIRFDSGTIVQTNWGAFMAGTVTTRSAERDGYTVTALNGLQVKCIKYINSRNVTALFEDGTLREGVDWTNFRRGEVAHPHLRKGSTFHGFSIEKIKKAEDGTTRYTCSCTRCREKGVMRPQEMMEHAEKVHGAKIPKPGKWGIE